MVSVKRSTRSSRLAAAPALIAGLMLAVALAGCESGDPAVVTPTATPAPLLPPLVVQYCVDDTGSYDSKYFTAANQLVAQAIMNRAAPGQQGATIYVTQINANTFSPDSTVKVITIPAVPAVPTQAAPPTSSNDNVFEAATATAQAKQAQQQATATYTALEQAEQAALVSAKQTAQDGAAFVQGLTQQPAEMTDVYGCLMVASSNFALAPAGTQKLLIIASDLQNNVTPASDPRTITGARVMVLNYLCPQAQGCDTTKTTWLKEFHTDGATDTKFYSPAETQAVLNGQTLFS